MHFVLSFWYLWQIIHWELRTEQGVTGQEEGGLLRQLSLSWDQCWGGEKVQGPRFYRLSSGVAKILS